MATVKETSCHVHLSRVNSHDFKARLFVRMGHFDAPINTTGANEGLVKDVEPVGGHHDLDVGGGFETVKLIQKLQHCALHFTITTTSTTVTTRGTDGINLRRSNMRCCKMHMQLGREPHP